MDKGAQDDLIELLTKVCQALSEHPPLKNELTQEEELRIAQMELELNDLIKERLNNG
jgi:hypothetical protein